MSHARNLILVLVVSSYAADSRAQQLPDESARQELRAEFKAWLIAHQWGRQPAVAPAPMQVEPRDPFGLGQAAGLATEPSMMLAGEGRYADEFETRLFGTRSGEAKRLLIRKSVSRLDAVAKDYELGREEVAKLRLATSGDIERYLGRCRELQHEYEAATGDGRMGEEILIPLVLLRREFKQGLFGEGSLYAKTLAKILADREAVAGTKP